MSAPAENARSPRAGDHDDARRRRPARARSKQRGELSAHALVHRVVHVGPVERDRRDAVGQLVANRLVGHLAPPARRHTSARGEPGDLVVGVAELVEHGVGVLAERRRAGRDRASASRERRSAVPSCAGARPRDARTRGPCRDDAPPGDRGSPSTVWTGAAGMSCLPSSSSQYSRGFDLNLASISGKSAWLFSSRAIHEAKRGSSARWSMLERLAELHPERLVAAPRGRTTSSSPA